MGQIFFSFKLLLTLCVASIVGLGGTWIVLESEIGIESVQVGPWVSRLPVGAGIANPYARAALARSGAIPVAATEAITFVARTDGEGRPLSPSCSYTLSSSRIDARWWTLTVSNGEGTLIENPMHRHAFTSDNVVRAEDGTFTIMLSREAAPGNWLPAGDDGPLTLTLRLYDTPLYTNGALGEAPLPAIDRGACA